MSWIDTSDLRKDKVVRSMGTYRNPAKASPYLINFVSRPYQIRNLPCGGLLYVLLHILRDVVKFTSHMVNFNHRKVCKLISNNFIDP